MLCIFHCARFLFDKIHGKPTLQLDSLDEEEDKDVQAEQDRVASGLADYDMLQLQNLTKIYHLPHKRIVAVKNVSIGIPAGEVSQPALGNPTSLLQTLCTFKIDPARLEPNAQSVWRSC